MLFKDLNKCLKKNPDFIFDEACIDIINVLNETVTIYGQYTECHRCKFQNYTTLEPLQNTSILVDTRFPFQMYYKVGDKTFCRNEKLLYEHYRYGWNITTNCNPIYIKEEADSAYLPILSAFIILFCFGTLWYMVKCIYKNSSRMRQVFLSFYRYNEIENDLGTSASPFVISRPPSHHIIKHPHRIKSLDVFRGFCITLMIFVNYGGGQYWFFKHSIWNGITCADLVFPWFLWIMGFSMLVSIQKKLTRNIPRRQLVVDVLRRSILLILFGLMINSHKNMLTIGELRLPGVLQRFGIIYLIVGILEIIFTKRNEIEPSNYNSLHDIIIALPQWIIIIIIIVIHSLLTFLVEIPNGCGKGYLGPGGLDEDGKFYNCTGGIAGYIDRAVFGQHIYRNGEFRKLYEGKVLFDPEGLLSTLTSIFLVYMGVQAGRIYNTYQLTKSKIIRWTIWGIFTALLGGILCEFKKNDGLIPINKNLWTLSFVLVLGGMAFLIEAILHILVDVKKKWGGRPLFYPGMNAIILYIGHILFKNTFPFAWKPSIESHASYLFMNLWGTFLWVAFSIFLYKNNYFLSL